MKSRNTGIGASMSTGNVSKEITEQKAKQKETPNDSRKPPHSTTIRDQTNVVKQKPKASDLRATSEVGKETNPRPVTAS
jgi:hypothetical protein